MAAEAAPSGRWWPHVLAGVAGRVAAETFVSPFNLLKVRLQYDYAIMRLPLPLAIYTVLREEGVRGAWRGLPPRLIWSAPLAAATFTYYQSLKRATGGCDEAPREEAREEVRAPQPSTLSRDQIRTLVLGPAVMALSVGLRTPFDIVEQQLQLSALRNPGGPQLGPPTPAEVMQRIRTVWQQEGYRGVWRGYPAAFLGIFTYVAGYFVVYEAARRSIEKTPLSNYSTATHLIAGGIGGGTTAALSTPFDTIKVRMQTKVYASVADPFPSMATVARATVRDAGVQGLWRGVLARIASNAPSGAIMFAVYEAGHRWIEARLDAK
ncbi:hypothetical protein AB1Y20_017243 [Prymnesium parvum]|uniref:Mitochondrial carrier protein n=1 Tax=Prymnesium parvum TaxID=97485 RepID=A0AB34JJY7_PRYPA